MAKRVTHAVEKVLEAQFGMNKTRRYVACDDGTTYVFESSDGRRWTALARYGRDGGRSASPSRLPASVEAHMDGATRSGPEGVDGDEYWT